MILNLSIDEQIVQRAQEAAERRGMSLDQFVQHCLEAATSAAQPKQSKEEWIAEFRRLTEEGQGHSGGWKFNREELYDRGSKD
jgi:antitoxin component of RelBE/YafQ-DinJ toxin-antitoxin module